MSDHPTDWDVDVYKCEHESKEQWQLRRSFMLKWKCNFSEDSLVCLARVFTNIEFLNCRYPTEVMKLVAELSKEVCVDYREKKKKKLQRTFVSASDAAEDRAKGTKRPHTKLANPDTSDQSGPVKKLFVVAGSALKSVEDNESTLDLVHSKDINHPTSSVSNYAIPMAGNNRFLQNQKVNQSNTTHHQMESQHPHMNNIGYQPAPSYYRNNSCDKTRGGNTNYNQGFNQRNNDDNSFRQREFSGRQYNACNARSTDNTSSSFQRFGDKKQNHNTNRRKHSNQAVEDTTNDLISSKYGKLVLFEITAPFGVKLLSSCQRSKITLEFTYEKDQDNHQSCSVTVNGIKVCDSLAKSQKEAKEVASETAWKILSGHCYTIVVKQAHVSKEDKKISVTEVETDPDRQKLDDGLNTKVESAVATRMMKLMGWGGGALGASSKGICEPIAPNLKQIHRAGLGSSNTGRSVMQAVEQTMQNYSLLATTDHDLVFAADFTKEERALMHKLALRLGLKSKSYGKDEDRYLVISKMITPGQLVKSLLESGCSNEKHTLLKPSSQT